MKNTKKRSRHGRAAQSDLTVRIANQWHCNSRALDFGVDANPIATAAAERKREGVKGNWRPQPPE